MAPTLPGCPEGPKGPGTPVAPVDPGLPVSPWKPGGPAGPKRRDAERTGNTELSRNYKRSKNKEINMKKKNKTKTNQTINTQTFSVCVECKKSLHIHSDLKMTHI